jgi:hypothetical protein
MVKASTDPLRAKCVATGLVNDVDIGGYWERSDAKGNVHQRGHTWLAS